MVSPAIVAITLLVLLSIGTTLYFFAIPDSLAGKSAVSKGNQGYWGPPTAEFDWWSVSKAPCTSFMNPIVDSGP